MAATASATDWMAVSPSAWPRARLSAAYPATDTRATRASRLPRRSSWTWSGVRPGPPSSSAATFPSSVAEPVATTRASARPRVSAVERNTEFDRSPREASGATSAACLATGSDSPVSVDSSTSARWVTTRRPSAATRSPASISSTSPTTTSAAGTSTTTPSRRTRARCAVIEASAASPASARCSCT